METKHECRPHFCEKCGYLATSKSGLNKHTREMHEGTGETEAGAGNNNQPDPAVQLVGACATLAPTLAKRSLDILGHWPSSAKQPPGLVTSYFFQGRFWVDKAMNYNCS